MCIRDRFLNDQIKQRGYKLVSVANTLISPIAFYSKKYKSLQALPEGAKVGIPNDPSNQTRALVILREMCIRDRAITSWARSRRT